MVMRAVDEFHVHYENSRIWEKTKWLGIPCYKLPFDAFILQEIIWNIKPDFVIETGTARGGAAVFYATILEILGHGKVITCDIEMKHDWTSFPKKLRKRIKFESGGSTNPVVFSAIEKQVKGKKNIVILDSDHSYDHVRQEMSAYSTLVSKGSYMVVEDTHVSGHPVKWEWGSGPYEAVQDFLKVHGDRWEADYWCEKYMMTFNPMGYLRRTK
jgi:cephalosporin hydroxylase